MKPTDIISDSRKRCRHAFSSSKPAAPPGQPKPLQAAQKAGQTLLATLATTDAAVAKAQKGLDDATSTLRDGRTSWMGAYKTLHAALTQKFPLDKDRVESYFAQPTVKAKAKVEGGVVVE